MASNPLKRYDSYKECIITTVDSEFAQMFTNDWSFTEIRSWMLDTYCIDENSIVELSISSKTIYKLSKT